MSGIGSFGFSDILKRKAEYTEKIQAKQVDYSKVEITKSDVKNQMQELESSDEPSAEEKKDLLQAQLQEYDKQMAEMKEEMTMFDTQIKKLEEQEKEPAESNAPKFEIQ